MTITLLDPELLRGPNARGVFVFPEMRPHPRLWATRSLADEIRVGADSQHADGDGGSERAGSR